MCIQDQQKLAADAHILKSSTGEPCLFQCMAFVCTKQNYHQCMPSVPSRPVPLRLASVLSSLPSPSVAFLVHTPSSAKQN